MSLLSRCYGLGVTARATAYDLGLLPVHRVEGLTVLSIGGLRAGGEGKTPMTLELARQLARRGLKTAIVARGYRGRLERRGGVVSDGRGSIIADACLGGDEAVMQAQRAPEVAVVVGGDRVRAAERARELGAEVAVLDSGFQHRRLARNLNILLVGWPWTLDEPLLPAGRLRESPSELKRADLIGWQLPQGSPSPPPTPPAEGFLFQLEPTELVDTSLRPVAPLEELRGTRVLVVAGIARPQQLEGQLRALGACPVDILSFPDHHPFSARDRRRITARAHRAGADLVLTTEKDLVRLGPVTGTTVRALRVEVRTWASQPRLFRAAPLELISVLEHALPELTWA